MTKYLFADATYGHLTANQNVNDTTLVVATDQGTFPTPAAGQAFTVVVNPNVSALKDNATTERRVVTANASGTFTCDALTHAHSSGEQVVLVATSLSLPVTASGVESLFAADQQIFSGTGAGTGELIDLLTAFNEYFTAKGDLLLGTGAGTGALLSPIGADGTVLTADSTKTTGAKWAAAGAALTNLSGHMSSNTPCAAGDTTVITTGTLAVGTWLVNMSALIQLGANTSSDYTDLRVTVNSGTATLEGKTADGIDGNANGAGLVEYTQSAHLNFIVTVTVAATLNFVVHVHGTSAETLSATQVGYSNATGYTAVKIG